MENHDTNWYFQAYKNGDEVGFDFFFREYYSALCFYANKLVKSTQVAEEIASDAFIKVWKHRQKFINPEMIKGYLFVTARNDCYKELNRRSLENKANGWFATLEKDKFERSHLDAIITAEVVQQIYQASNSLPPHCKKIFTEIFENDKKVKEISSDLHIAHSTIKNQKARAIKKIRKNLPDVDENIP